MKTISLAFFVALMVLGCGGDDVEGGLSDGVRVEDVTGQSLGRLLSADAWRLWILSPTDHIYWLSWDGTPGARAPNADRIFYSETNCAGIPYGEGTGGGLYRWALYGKTVWFPALNRGPMIPANVKSDGTAEGKTTTTVSSLDGNGQCGTQDISGISIVELRAVSRAEVGIPDVINAPLKIVSD